MSGLDYKSIEEDIVVGADGFLRLNGGIVLAFPIDADGNIGPLQIVHFDENFVQPIPVYGDLNEVIQANPNPSS